MPDTLADLTRSYLYCRRVVRETGSSFAIAFHLLPRDQHRAMDALYAFMRITDDLSDEVGEVTQKQAKLTAWRRQFHDCLEGRYTHPIHAAVHHAISQFRIDPKYLLDTIDGVESDLSIQRYATFADLYPYCYRVASAVGLSCIAIWGCHDPMAKQPAEEAGIAFQLTNILRDLGEDCERGRVYLPTEDWQRFGCPPEQWQQRSEAFREMMQFEVARVREYYEKSEALVPLLPRPGRTMFRVMSGTYRELLRRIEASDFDVIGKRQRVPTWKKLSIFARMWMTD